MINDIHRMATNGMGDCCIEDNEATPCRMYVDRELLQRSVMDALSKKIAALHIADDTSDIAPDTNFQIDLGADSLDMINFGLWAFAEFDVDLPDDALFGAKTVGQFVDVVAAAAAAAAAADALSGHH